MDFLSISNKFSSEELCRDYIYKVRFPEGFRCSKCGNKSAWKTSELKYKCKKCRTTISITSGTVFQDTHIPLSKWFQSVWYMSDINNRINATVLQKEIGLGSNRTAQAIIHTIKKAMVCDSLERLTGIVEIATRDMRVKNYYGSIVSAIEISENKIGRIRVQEIERNNKNDLLDFIDSTITPGSSIIQRERQLLNFDSLEKYTLLSKNDRYSFLKTAKVINKLQSWLYRYYSGQETIQALLDDFCLRVNSLKTSYDYFDLLNKLINLNPQKLSSEQYGIEL